MGTSFGVCLRLQGLLERLFPGQMEQRRKETEQERTGEAVSCWSCPEAEQPIALDWSTFVTHSQFKHTGCRSMLL